MDGSRKRERDYETGDAAIADFAKSLDNDARAGSKAPGTVAYLPCKTFSGLREGYYFKLGPQGPGQGLALAHFRAQLEDLRDTLLTLELNVSTFGTHPRVIWGTK
jgi:hypothetical protein